MGVVGGLNIVKDGLVLLFDASNPKCNSGVGTVIKNLVGDNHGTLSSSSIGDKNFLFNSENGDNIQFNSDHTLYRSGATMNVWFKSVGNYVGNFQNRGAIFTNNYQYFRLLVLYDDGSRYRIDGESNSNELRYTYPNTTYLDKSVWYNIIIVFDNNISTTYLNGVEVHVMGVDDDLTLNLIGGAPIQTYPNDIFFDGEINYVSFYDRGLSGDEVAQNYNSLYNRFNV